MQKPCALRIGSSRSTSNLAMRTGRARLFVRTHSGWRRPTYEFLPVVCTARLLPAATPQQESHPADGAATDAVQLHAVEQRRVALRGGIELANDRDVEPRLELIPSDQRVGSLTYEFDAVVQIQLSLVACPVAPSPKCRAAGRCRWPRGCCAARQAATARPPAGSGTARQCTDQGNERSRCRRLVSSCITTFVIVTSRSGNPPGIQCSCSRGCPR